MIVWTVGAGGLLGRAVSSRADTVAETFDPGPIPWADPVASSPALAEAVRAFRAAAGAEPWAIVWAAGAATVASPPEQAERELRGFTGFLEALRGTPPSGRGAFLLASSAGGVYAGSVGAPFSAATAPQPVGAYGRLKLAQEQAATAALADTCPVVLARIANLYGPGQNLGKLQGLVSRLAWCAARQEPANIFVPLDTVRDYIDHDDAARASLSALANATGPSTVEVIASGRPVTIGQLVRVVGQVTRRRVPVALGTHASARDQVLDLRLEPSVHIDDATPLPAGVKRVYLDILARLQQGSPAATA